jgi:maltose O-acetyltransferase
MISHDVNIIDSTSHSKDSSERHDHFKAIITKGHPDSFEDLPGVKSRSIVIEDDVWISYGCSIFPGVKIGKGSIIASNSLVLNDVPANTLFRNLVNEIELPLKFE